MNDLYRRVKRSALADLLGTLGIYRDGSVNRQIVLPASIIDFNWYEVNMRQVSS